MVHFRVWSPSAGVGDGFQLQRMTFPWDCVIVLRVEELKNFVDENDEMLVVSDVHFLVVQASTPVVRHTSVHACPVQLRIRIRRFYSAK